MKLRLLAGEYAVCRLPPDADVPEWAVGDELSSVTRTRAELSVVCDAAGVPGHVQAEAPWRALEVEGPLDLALTGVLAQLTVPLADAGVPVFAIATYDTDYVLVRGEDLESATKALQAAGHEVARPPSAT